MNSIELFMDERVIQNVEPRFKKKAGTLEQQQKRYTQFMQCNTESVKLFALYAGKPFYLTNQYDERGRTYTHGFHFNPQGDDYRKSLIELADRELIQQ